MRKFKFRLERLLNFRRSMTERERTHFAEKVGIQVRAEQHENNLRDFRDATRRVRIGKLQEGMTPGEIGNLHEHLIRIDESIGHAGQEIARAKEATERVRVELVKKRRDERTIELHRERRWKSWLKDYHRDETRTLDDIATIRHVRDRGSNDG
jgi:flagellar protein FliJ